jgi:hypothetical protein
VDGSSNFNHAWMAWAHLRRGCRMNVIQFLPESYAESGKSRTRNDHRGKGCLPDKAAVDYVTRSDRIRNWIALPRAPLLM